MPLFYLSKRIFYGAIREIIIIINKQYNAVISVLCGNFKGSNEKIYISGLDTKFWEHSPFGQVNLKMYLPDQFSLAKKFTPNPPPPRLSHL